MCCATISVLLALPGCATTPEKLSIGNIECALDITGRQEYFDKIEGIVAGYAVPQEGGARLEKEPRTPQPIEGHIGVYQQTLYFVAPNPTRFADLVEEINALAVGQELYLRPQRLTATFDTSGGVNLMEHVVSGNVRSGSKLYLVRRGVTPSLNEAVPVSESGSYRVTIRLEPAQRYIYQLSIYVPEGRFNPRPLPIFSRLDVHSQLSVEMRPQEFEQEVEVSFSEQLLRQLAGQ